MKYKREAFACVLIVILMSIVTLITVVVSTITQQFVTLAHNRTLHMQRYYMTRALFAFAHEHDLQQELIIQLPFSHAMNDYSGKITRNTLVYQQNIITAQLYYQATLVCTLAQLE